MRRFLMMTAIAATTLGAAQVAQADARPDGPPPVCRPDQKKCPEAPHGVKPRKDAPREDRRGPPPPAETRGNDQAHRGPRPGDGPEHIRRAEAGDHGRVFKPGRDSRLEKAPRGKEYRVIDDKLVLVNKKDKKIVRVIGPAPRQ